MQIGIKGYQSIKKAVFDLKPGEIVGIVGENNLGKSSIVRAIEGFITNEAGSKFINNDLKVTKVAIKTDRGLFIWDKTEKISNYTKNGKSETKLGRDCIDEVFPNSGFLVERGEGFKLVPSIVHEQEVLFPFNLTPSGAFKIFSRFMSSPKIEVIIKDLKDNIKETKVSLNKIRGSIDTYETEKVRVLEEIKNFPSEKEMHLLEAKVEKYLSLEMRWKYANSSLKNLLEKRKRIKDELIKINVKEIEKIKVKVAVSLGRYAYLDKLKNKLECMKNLEMRKLEIKTRISQLDSLLKSGNMIKSKEQKIVTLVSVKKNLNKREDLKFSLKNIEGKVRTLLVEKEQFKFCPLCKRPFRLVEGVK